MPSTESDPPPYARARVVYDDTYRNRIYASPSIMSMAQVSHVLGFLEHHSPNTDGSFGICVAQGEGIFVSKVHFVSKTTHIDKL